MARRRRARASRGGARLGRALRAVVLRAGLLALVAVVGYGAWLDLEVRGQFEGRRWQVPARIYARPLELFAGASLRAAAVEGELRAAGYHRDGRLSRPATYRGSGDVLEVRTRSFRYWDAEEAPRRLRLQFSGATLAGLSSDGEAVPLARLEPVLIGRIHPQHQEDRILVRLEDVPRSLVAALLAAEDRSFFEHHGVSLKGMARALLANLRAGGTVQGGSTLTQQLAKSYFLSAERSLWRKLNDVLIALILEARYSKDEILEAYLNEVYLGQDGPRSVHGFGLGARHYFDRRLDELTLTETALLAALVKGPSLYNPRRHPQRALERRNRVLGQMQELGIITEAQLRDASEAPLGVTREPGQAGSSHPAFLDLVRRQLRRDYRDDDLQNEGLRVFTTLDPGVQEVAAKALETTLAQLESTRSALPDGLQGAVVVTDSQSAEVLAMVGGRTSRASGFNRAMDARRPIGSLVKPVVYLAALSRPERYHLASPLLDEPVKLEGARGEPWTPKNYDGTTHGSVPLIEALSRSYNLATVRLGAEVGIETVRDQLVRMGVERPVNAFPSLLLGAVELSPLEVAGVYQSLAGGGFRQPLRAIRDVTDAGGKPLERYGIDVTQVADPRANYLTVRAMQEVMRSGTGRSAGARLPEALAPAGKTGTTDDLRDSWFAGFAGDRLAVVWVGRDDNRSARLTGASGALKVWTRLFLDIPVRPLSLEPPEGILWGLPVSAGADSVQMMCAPGADGRLPFIPTGSQQDGCSVVQAPPTGGNGAAPPRQGTRWNRRAEEAN